MFSRITRYLGIVDGEWSRLLPAGSLALLLMLGWALGRSARTAIFIKEAGPDNIPYMYVIGAILAVVISPLYASMVDRLSRQKLMILLLSSAAILLCLLRVLIPFDLLWVPYAVFAIADLTVILVFFMHFWTFANDVFDPREGKRLFPLVGSAGLIGTITGGLLVKPILGLIDTIDLLVVWALILGASIPLVIWLHRANLRSGAKTPKGGKSAGEKKHIRQRFAEVWQVPLLRTLTYLAIPMWLVINIVDYQYLIAMNEVFSEQDQLTGFLGIFGSITSLTSLAIQLFVTGRLLKRFGVGFAVLAHPISLTFGTGMLAIRSLLPVPAAPQLLSFRALSGAFAKFSDSTLDRSIAESANQLLYNALPEDQRGQGRAFISGTVKPLVTVMAGGVLILFGLLEVPFYVISFAAVVFALIWVALAARIKTDYLRALVTNLSSRDLELSREAMSALSGMKDATTLSILLDAVASSDAQVARFSLNLLRDIDDPSIPQRLCTLLPKVHPHMQTAILGLLTDRPTEELIPTAGPLLKSPEISVRAAAIRAYGRHGSTEALQQLDSFVRPEEPLPSRSEAIIALLRDGKSSQSNGRVKETLHRMLTDDSVETRRHAAYILGEVGDAAELDPLLRLAASVEEPVQQAVIEAMVKLRNPQALPVLIRFLATEGLSAQAADAIVALGEPAVEPLHQALQTESTESGDFAGSFDGGVKLKSNITSCLGRLQQPASIPLLAAQLTAGADSAAEDSILDALIKIRLAPATDGSGVVTQAKPIPTDAEQRVRRLFSSLLQTIGQRQSLLSALQQNGSGRATLLLVDTLQRGVQRLEKRALQCLQLLSDPTAIRAATSNLRRRDSRSKAEAIELLGESGPEGKQLADTLECLYFPSSQSLLEATPADLMRASLGMEQSTWSRVCHIYAVGELQMDDLTADLQALADDKQQLIRANADLALSKLGHSREPTTTKAEVQQMAHMMERILFLKSVPLFAEMNGDDLQWIADIAREESYPANAVIFRENDPGDAFYIIEKGRVRIVKGEQNPLILAIREEREYIGEMAILDDEPRVATAEAQDELRLLVIDREEFQQLVLARPSIAFPLFRTLSKRLREASDNAMSQQS